MSDRAELLAKLEAMRSEVRAYKDNGAESVRVLVRAVDALTFVVIGMLEAQDDDVVDAEIMCGELWCIRRDHDSRHMDEKGQRW